ncbi:MAG: YihY family inner membrane protein, partial [Curvibacter sp.]
MQAKPLLTSWLREIASIPWRDAAITLRERFREDRLGLTASSLTFTTTIALVPLITVALAVFTAFPMFAKFQDVLQKWLIESLVPDNIARQVLGYLNQFAGKASRLGVAGLTILLGTALALIFTIDRTLNSIWRVKKRRPFGQRVLIYWAAVT